MVLNVLQLKRLIPAYIIAYFESNPVEDRLIYVALLRLTAGLQTATVLKNTLGFIPLWERVDVGEYQTSDSRFTASKTTVLIGNTPDGIIGTFFDGTTIHITSKNNSLAAEDGLIFDASIEISVYP